MRVPSGVLTGRDQRAAVGRYPAVEAVPAGPDRPRWSVVVPTYHCARYLGRTLLSVLAQDPGPEQMEVVVVDDHSVDDDPKQVVREVAGDRVRFVRSERNAGHVRTFNRCLQLARGQQVHLLHGDDWVEDGFYAAADEVLAARPDVLTFVAGHRQLMESTGDLLAVPPPRPQAGVLEGWLEELAARQRLQTCSIAVRRVAYERTGGFDEGIAGYGEDWEMWVRLAAAGPVWFDPRPMAVYRVRAGSLSSVSRLGRNMGDMRRVVALNARTLRATGVPASRVDAVTRDARRQLAEASLTTGHRAMGAGDPTPAPVAAGQALRFSPGPRTALRAGQLMARWAWARTRSR